MKTTAILSAALVFLLVAAAILTAAVRESAETVEVRFTAPTTHYLAGIETIEIEVDLPAGDRIDQVDLFVDGAAAGSVRRPPFRFEHDFGTTLRPRLLLALVFTRGGRTGRAEFQSRAAPVTDRVDVSLVQMNVTVIDADGRFVKDLDRDDFRLLEAGVEQEIAVFERGDAPAAIALAFDCSGSMGNRMERARREATGFVKMLPAHYQVSVLGFNHEVWLARDFTAEKPALVYALNQLQPKGETALYDAIRAASLHLGRRPERRAVVLFTDGAESKYEDDAAGEARLAEVLEAANRSEVTFFAIGYGGNFTADLLGRIATATGGRFYPARGIDLGTLYAEISATLGSQYTLAYYPEPAAAPGDWRPVEVRLIGTGNGRGDLRIRTRSGYRAGRR